MSDYTIYQEEEKLSETEEVEREKYDNVDQEPEDPTETIEVEKEKELKPKE